MVIAAIMAAGLGRRVGADVPKQFLEIGGVTVLRRSVDAFLRSAEVDSVLVLCPRTWFDYTLEIFSDILCKIRILSGGDTRTQTLEIALRYWYENFGSDDDILLTHDAARPFVSQKIIEKNIALAYKYGACGTYIACADSLTLASNGFIGSPVSRDGVFRAQTPQSFRAAELYSVMNRLTDAQKETLTDACGTFSLLSKAVAVVEGECLNFKLTTPDDVRLAEIIARGL